MENALALEKNLTPLAILQIAANGDNETLKLIVNKLEESKQYTDNSLAMVRNEFQTKLENEREEKIELRKQVDGIADKINYNSDDKYLSLHALGDTFSPTIRNKMAIILKWLGIVYYNSDASRYVPFAHKLGRLCREMIKETKYGYRYKEYTYHCEFIHEILKKELEKRGWLKEFEMHKNKAERDNWIKRNIE